MRITDLDKVTIDEHIFSYMKGKDTMDYDNCVLYVPAGTRWKYRHHSVFGRFKNIKIESVKM